MYQVDIEILSSNPTGTYLLKVYTQSIGNW